MSDIPLADEERAAMEAAFVANNRHHDWRPVRSSPAGEMWVACRIWEGSWVAARAHYMAETERDGIVYNAEREKMLRVAWKENVEQLRVEYGEVLRAETERLREERHER